MRELAPPEAEAILSRNIVLEIDTVPIPYRLSKVLEFTNEDLAANQRGEMSDQQRQRLRDRRLWALILAGVMLIFPIIGLIVILQRPLDAGGVFILVLAAIWILLFGGIGWLAVTQTRSELRSGQVVSVTGVAKLEQVNVYKGPNFYLTIETVKFRIDAGVYWTFKAGERYQVFYTPESMVILSAIWLRN